VLIVAATKLSMPPDSSAIGVAHEKTWLSAGTFYGDVVNKR